MTTDSTTATQFDLIMQSSIFRIDGYHIGLLDALQSICDCINAEKETDWYLGEGGECYLSDLIPAAYWALTMCHAGQESQSYSVMCSLGGIFKPGCCGGPEEDSPEMDVYNMLCKELLR
jgi:hypothetical protein